MMKRRAMHGSSTAMCARLCAWPRDWRGLMPRPARPSKSATTRPPARKSAPPPGAPAVVATTTANPPPNCRNSAPAANGVPRTPRAKPSAPEPGAPTKPAQATPRPTTRRSSAPAANGVHSTPRANPFAPGAGAPTKPAQATPHPTTRRSSAPAANGVHSTPQTPPFAPGAGAPTKPAQATPNPPPVGAAPRCERRAQHPPNAPLRPPGRRPYNTRASHPTHTTRRSSAPAANGVHSTPRAWNGGPLEATLPKPDRDPLQLLRRRFGTQTQVFADSPHARGGQVAPLTQGLKHPELLPLGRQLTGLDLLVQAPAGTVAGQAPAHLAQRHYHLIPPRLLHGLQLAPQSGIGLQSMRAQPAGGQQQQHILAVLILQPQQQLLHLRLRIQPAGVIGQAGHRLYPRR